METILATRKEIGEKIREERKKQLLTQYDLCLITKCSLRTITTIEKGQGNYLIDFLIEICQKLNIEIIKSKTNENDKN